MMQFISRDYNNIEKIDSGTLKKSSSDEKIINEINYLENIPAGLQKYFPKINNAEHSNGKSSYLMDFYDYRNLGQILFEDKFDKERWKSIYQEVLSIQREFAEQKYHLNVAQRRIHQTEMFEQKTKNEFIKLLNHPFFQHFFNQEEVKINGKTYYNPKNIVNRFNYKLAIDGSPFSFMHGDFCFSNILCSDRQHCIKLIDPRGSFGSLKGCYGDIAYDESKFLHSSHYGYEAIIYDRFELRIKSMKEISWKFYDQDKFDALRECLGSISIDYNNTKSQLIAATIFLGMAARHYDSLERQIVMVGTAFEILGC